MATKRKLSEQIIRILSGGDVRNDSDIDVREVMQAIDTSRDSVVSNYLNSTVFCKTCPEHMETNIISSFVTKFSASIAATGVADIPEVMPLPDDMGVYYVKNSTSPQNFYKREFVRVPAAFESFFHGMQSRFLEGLRPYSLERSNGGVCKLIFPDVNVFTNIHVYIIPLTKEYAEDAELPGGGVIDDAVVKNVLQIYGVMFQVPHDEENDNIKPRR